MKKLSLILSIAAPIVSLVALGYFYHTIKLVQERLELYSDYSLENQCLVWQGTYTPPSTTKEYDWVRPYLKYNPATCKFKLTGNEYEWRGGEWDLVNK